MAESTGERSLNETREARPHEGSGYRFRVLVPAAVVLVVLLGAFLRLYRLGAPSISEDEAYQTVVASSWASTGSPLPPSGRPYTRAMPLIALQALALKYLPVELETSVRLPSALLGILNIWLVFLLGRRYGGAGLGLVAALIFAVSPWCIHWGREARMYELLMTGTLLTFLAYETLVEHPTWRNLAWLVAALGLSVTAHDLGILLIFLPLAGIAVHLKQPRVAALLGAAAGGQLLFRQVYPAVLELLVPPGPEASLGRAAQRSLMTPVIEAQQLAWESARWIWLLGVSVLAAAVFAYLLRRRERSEIYRLLPWTLAVVIAGSLGFLLVGGMIVAAFIAFSGLWAEPPGRIRTWRFHMIGWFTATALLWAVLATVIAIEHGAIGLSSVLKNLAQALRYPEVFFSVVRPLLIAPHARVLFHVGLAGSVILLLHVLIKGPILPGGRSLTTRVLFLLATSTFIGIAASLYKTDRYVYFLFPAMLLCFLETMRAYLLSSRWAVRMSVMSCGVLLVALVELPSGIDRLPTESGQLRPPEVVNWLPRYGSRTAAHDRSRMQLDYRAAGAELRARMREGDLLLADAAHQIQVYVPRVDGHLSPRLREYQHGTRHYFTGSALLHSTEDLLDFLASADSSGQVWILLTGYRSIWSECLPGLLSGREAWAQGSISLYQIPVSELSRMRCNSATLEEATTPQDASE